MPVLLISPSLIWNMSWHREHSAAFDRNLPWPQVFISREQRGVSTQPGKTSDVVAMVGIYGSADSGWFMCFPILLVCWQGWKAIILIFFFFQCDVFLLSNERVFFAIRLHSLVGSEHSTPKTTFLAKPSGLEWLFLEQFWPLVRIDFLKAFNAWRRTYYVLS